MPKTHNIKSFTLSEMIVVLVVTSIVVALAFSVLTLVQRQMKSMTHHYTERTQWQLLEQSLWIDFHRYREISYQPKTQTLLLKHELDSVRYVFYADKIVKDRDTFPVSVKTTTGYNNGKAVSGGTLNAIRLQAGGEKETPHKTLFIFKKNDAANTINSWHFN